jgi:hypothetical protein
VVLAAVCLTGACATAGSTANQPAPSAPTHNEIEGTRVDVRLTYTRPSQLGTAGRPAGFEVIANYRSSDTITEYEGTWNDATLTLTAIVPLQAKSDNLVYVIDDAVPPGLPTSIAAGQQARVHEAVCPRAVTTLTVCYELTVTSGLP